MNKRMGAFKPLNQQGISLFEISIIALIVILIAVSAMIMISKLDNGSKSNYDKYNDVRSMNPLEDN